eukprot:1116563-Rhodomonas_salina.2
MVKCEKVDYEAVKASLGPKLEVPSYLPATQSLCHVRSYTDYHEMSVSYNVRYCATRSLRDVRRSQPRSMRPCRWSPLSPTRSFVLSCRMLLPALLYVCCQCTGIAWPDKRVYRHVCTDGVVPAARLY